MLLIILPVVGLLTRVDAYVSQLVTANNEFAWRLYDRLTYAPSSASNAYFCPLSVFSIITLTNGDTRRHITEALRYGDSNDTLEFFQDLRLYWCRRQCDLSHLTSNEEDSAGSSCQLALSASTKWHGPMTA